MNQPAMRLVSTPAVVWTCRVVLVLYAVLIGAVAWSAYSDWETTMRLIGSEPMCGILPFFCTLTGHIVAVAIDATVLILALVSEIARSWRHRDVARAVALVLAIAHLAARQIDGALA